MPRRLIYAPQALADLASVSVWLTQPGSGPRAWRRLAAIRNSIQALHKHPCRWPVGKQFGARELPCQGGYRVLYEVVPDTGRDETAGDVVVLRVYGPGQPREGP